MFADSHKADSGPPPLRSRPGLGDSRTRRKIEPRMANRHLGGGTPKAVGYARARTIPTNPLAEEAMIQAQIRAVSSVCGRQGWQLDEVFVDRGASANDRTRPGLVGALELLQARGHVALVVSDLDRLVRRPTDLLALQAKAASSAWRLVSARP